jgi:hypothetical protein
MALYLRQPTGRDSSGRITYSEPQRVGYAPRPGGGYTQVPGGQYSSPTEGYIDQQRREEAARIERETATREESSNTAVASTVGPGGVPSVIRQKDIVAQGGFSTVVNGGRGVGVASYSLYTRDVVPIAGAKEPSNNSVSVSRPQGTFTEFTGKQPGFGSQLRQEFTAGFRQDVIGQTIGGRQSDMGQFAERTPQRIARDIGVAGRGFGEASAYAVGIPLVVRGAGAATASVRASRFGSLPIARTVFQEGIRGQVARGGTIFVAGSFATRAVEQRNIGRLGSSTGISGLPSTVDEASFRYEEGSGFGRRAAESVSFLFADRQRFSRNVESSLVERGVSPLQARETGEEITFRRTALRARTDLGFGVGAEFIGEGVGRRATTLFGRSAFVQSVSNRWGTRAGFVAARGFGSATGGLFEGAAQAASQDIQSTGRVRPSSLAIGGGFGAAFAGAAGGTLALLRTSTRRGSARAANVLEGTLDVIDPLERPGDLAYDAYAGGYRASAIRAGYPRVVTPSVDVTGFGVSSSSRTPSRTTTGTRTTPLNSLTPFSSGGARTTSVSSRSFDSGVPALSGFSPSRGRNSVFVPSINDGGGGAFTTALTPSRSRGLVPSTPTRQSLQSFTSTRTQTNTFTNAFTFVPTRTTTNVPTRTTTNVPTRVPTPPGFGFFPPVAGGGLFGAGGGRGGRKNRIDSYAPSLTGLAIGFRQSKGARRSSGFTGLEIRGL